MHLLFEVLKIVFSGVVLAQLSNTLRAVYQKWTAHCVAKSYSRRVDPASLGGRGGWRKEVGDTE